MRYEIHPETHQFFVYEDDEPDAYIASCFLSVYGDVGIIKAMSGKHLLNMLCKALKDLSKEPNGIQCFQGYVTDFVYKASLIFAKRNGLTLTKTRECTHHGRHMNWIIVEML